MIWILSNLLFLIFTIQSLCALDYWKGEDYFQHSSSQKDAANDLLKYVKIAASDNILDVGCGDGKITAEISLLLTQGSILGVDISPSMIAFAQDAFPSSSYPNLTFLIQDAQQLNYRDEFDVVFSFTALQWIQDHNAFLKSAHRALKEGGTLAITMPMGLPSALKQAVNEIISMSQWSSYFQNFSSGWNFVTEDEYAQLLSDNHFIATRLVTVPQRDIFPSRNTFEKFISQWFPYLRPLPEAEKVIFMNQVLDRFLEIDTSFPKGQVHFKIKRLEVVAEAYK